MEAPLDDKMTQILRPFIPPQNKDEHENPCVLNDFFAHLKASKSSGGFFPPTHPFKAQGNLPDPAAWVKPFCTIFAKPCTRTVPAQGFLSMCCLTSRWKNMVPKKNAFPKSKIPIFLCRHLVGHQCLAKLIQGSFAEMGSVQLGSIWVHSQTKRKHTSRTTQYVVWWWWQRKCELFCILLSTVRIAGHIGPTSLPLEETSPLECNSY